MGTGASAQLTRKNDGGNISVSAPIDSDAGKVLQTVTRALSSGDSPTPVHHPKPRGRPPNGCEWDSAKGEWVKTNLSDYESLEHVNKMLVESNEQLKEENRSHVNELVCSKNHIESMTHQMNVLSHQHSSTMFTMLLYGNMTGVIRYWLDTLPSLQHRKLLMCQLCFLTEIVN